jgi:transcriptional repressor NrdR
MKCPYCDAPETAVIETRESDEASTRRRRECASCERRFTTYERVELKPLRVVKKDGTRTLFDRMKLKRGFVVACEKRPVTDEQIEDAVQDVEMRLRLGDSDEVQSKIIGDLVMRKLKKLDNVAYIRFASVYKEFQDLDDFKDEMKTLQKPLPQKPLKN